MTTYGQLMNGGLLYVLSFSIIILVAIICAIFFVKSKKQAEKLGVSGDEIKTIIKNSIVLSIVPSIAIVVGLFSLCAVVGIPWAQLRLSVIGSYVYELMAAQIATSTMGIAETTAAKASSATVFATVMFVMSICSCPSPVLNAFISKPLTQGIKKAGTKSTFSFIMNNCFMVAMFAVMVPIYFAKGIVTIMVMLTAAAFSYIIAKLAVKLNAKWLNEFNLSCCLIIGMVSSIMWTNIFG